MSQLEKQLATSIEPSIVQELLRFYSSLKVRFRLCDYKTMAVEAGSFCEAVVKALYNLGSGRTFTAKGIKFEDEWKNLTNLPKPDIMAEDLREVIPHVAKSTYTLRSKKQVAHARGTEIDYVDACLIVQSCDWMLAELLWLTHKIPDEEALKLMTDIMQMDLPLLEKLGDDYVITDKEIGPAEAFLVVLLQLGGSAPSSDVMTVMRRRFSDGSSYRARNQAIDDLLVHLSKSNVLYLTKNGTRRAQEIVAQRIKTNT